MPHVNVQLVCSEVDSGSVALLARMEKIHGEDALPVRKLLIRQASVLNSPVINFDWLSDPTDHLC